MKLLNSVPMGNGSSTFYLPRGQYGTFFIEYTGTAAPGVTITRANCGNVILNWNGQDVINADAEILNLLDNVYGGVAAFSSAAGGAFYLAVIITCGEWFDSGNVYDIEENDRVSIKLDFPDLADVANVVSGNVNIYAKNKVGIMNYLHNIISRPVVASGAATLADTAYINNVGQMYFKAPASLLSRIQIAKDNQTIIDAPPSTLINYSDWIHQLETTGTTLAIDFIESKDVREALGASINYTYTFTGAGTLEQYFSYLTFTPIKANVSLQRAVKILQAKNTPVTKISQKTVNTSVT